MQSKQRQIAHTESRQLVRGENWAQVSELQTWCLDDSLLLDISLEHIHFLMSKGRVLQHKKTKQENKFENKQLQPQPVSSEVGSVVLYVNAWQNVFSSQCWVLKLSIMWLVNHGVNHLFSLAMSLPSPTPISFKSIENPNRNIYFKCYWTRH